MSTSKNSLRWVLALGLMGALTTSACTAEIAGDASGDPGSGEPNDPGEPDPEEPEPEPDPEEPEPEPEPEPDDVFDVNDPSDYRWSLHLETHYTLPVLRGSAQVDYARFAAGVDPLTGTATESGTVQGPVFLAQNLSWSELTTSSFQFRTTRIEDGQPMTSCVKLVDAAKAIESHNAILADGQPETASTGFTSPDEFQSYLSAQSSIFMLVDGDCTTPSADNPTELRSVLSWTAVTFEATPDPAVYEEGVSADPSGGIDPTNT